MDIPSVAKVIGDINDGAMIEVWNIQLTDTDIFFFIYIFIFIIDFSL